MSNEREKTAPLVARRFELIRELGRGGMGVVHEAYDRHVGARVALKTLLNLNARNLLLFKNEFRTLQGVSHPNLVTLGELIQDEDQWFFTMELIAGQSLISFIRGETGASSEESATHTAIIPSLARSTAASEPSTQPQAAAAAHIDFRALRAAFHQLAAGLMALHAANLVHRDIKPGNVLVDGAGRVVLLDFGLIVDRSTQLQWEQGLVVGTMGFMAPEQFDDSSRVTAAADWYSFGVLLFVALTGRSPVVGSPMAMRDAKSATPVRAPSALAAGIPEDLDRLCVELMHPDPAQRPSGVDTLARLQGGDRVRSAQGHTQFVGRRAELDLLHGFYRDMLSGQPATVVLSGRSGFGKSRMARQFTQELLEQHADVWCLATRCHERESVSYKAIDGIIDVLTQRLRTMPAPLLDAILPPQAEALTELFPVLGQLDELMRRRERAGSLTIDRGHVFGSLRQLIINLSRHAPLVLSIDDIQWADEDSFALFEVLLRPPLPARLLVVATQRLTGGIAADGSPSDAIAARLTGVVRTLVVQSLPTDVALTLALQRAHDPAQARRIVDEAHGHPLFIEMMTRPGVSHGATSLDDMLRRDLDRLSDWSRRVLAATCLAGNSATLETIARAAGVELVGMAAITQSLAAQNLVRLNGAQRSDVIEPFHDRVRETVAAHLPEDERRRVHLGLAQAIEQTNRRAAELIGAHYRDAGKPDLASQHFIRAAGLARRSLAFDKAAKLYAAALTLNQSDATVARSLRIKLGQSLSFAGRGREAADAYLQASAGADADVAFELEREAANQLLRAGDVERGQTVLRSVMSSVDMKPPRSRGASLMSLLRRRFWLKLRGFRFRPRPAEEIPPLERRRMQLCWHTSVGLILIDSVLAADYLTRGLLLALRFGDLAQVAYGLTLNATFEATRGPRRAAHASAMLARAGEAAQRAGDERLKAWQYSSLATAYLLRGDFAESVPILQAATACFREMPGSVWELDTLSLFEQSALCWLGRLAEMRQRFLEDYDDARSRGDLLQLRSIGTSIGVLTALMRNDCEEARRLQTLASEGWQHREYSQQHFYALVGDASLKLYEGQSEAAWHKILDEWPQLRSSFAMEIWYDKVSMFDLRGRAALASALATSAPATRARYIKDVKWCVRQLRRQSGPWPGAMAGLLAAGIAYVADDRAEALKQAQTAANHAVSGQLDLHRHLAQLVTARCGASDAAATHEAVMAYFQSQGVVDWKRFAAMFSPTVNSSG